MSILGANRKNIPAGYDSFIGGLVTSVPAHKSSLNQSPDLENFLIDSTPGALVKRKGVDLLGSLPSGNAARFIYAFVQPDGTREFLVSDNSTLWSTQDGQAFTSLKTGLNSNFDLSAATVRGKVWLTNGDSTQPVMTYDGTTLVELDGSGGKPDPGRGKYIIFALNRVWIFNILNLESSIVFSDLFDGSGVAQEPDAAAAWPAVNQIDVAKNDGDSLYGAIEFAGSIYFFKSDSIHRLVGVDNPDFATVMHQKNIGTRFNRSLVSVDGIPHFLSEDGVYDMATGFARKISHLIQPDIDDLAQPDLNTLFKEWDTAADFDAGTYTQTASRSTKNDVILTNNGTGTFVRDDFNDGAIASFWSNTSGWIESGGVIKNPGLARTFDGTGLTATQRLEQGGWAGTIVLSGHATQIGVGTTEIFFFKFIHTSNGDGYGFGIKVNDPGSSPGGANEWEVELYRFDAGVRTLLAASGIQAPFPGATTFTITRDAAGLTTVTVGAISPVSATDTTHDASEQAILHTTDAMFSNGTDNATIDSISFPDHHTTGDWLSEAIDTEAVTAKSAWGTFDAISELNGETLTYEIAADPAVTMDSGGGGAPTHDFAPIVPGATIPFPIGATSRYVQVKAIFSSSTSATIPEFKRAQINWLLGGSPTQAVAAVSYNGQYWLSASRKSTGVTENDVIYVRARREFTPPEQRAAWMKFTGLNISHFAILSDNLFGADSRSGGNILRMDCGDRDLNSAGSAVAIDAFWKSREERFGVFPNTKQLWSIILDFERTGDYSFDAGYSRDGSSFTDTSVSVSGSGRDDKTLNVKVGRGKTFQFRVRNNGLDQPVTIYGLLAKAIPTISEDR